MSITTISSGSAYAVAAPADRGLRPAFRGRRAERATIDGLLGAGRQGRSGGLVVHGEAGVGKTALLGHAARQAAGYRVIRATGDATETELTYAGLHQLIGPLLDRATALPGPQREALLVGLGLADGAAPDRFLIAVATLNLLTDLASDRPVLALVDDADRLDEATAQVVGFVARRLAEAPVVLLLAAREHHAKPALGTLPGLRLEGLEADDARALLATVLTGRIDARVRERILAETRGNPLAILELSRCTRVAQLAGGFATPGAADVPARIQQEFEQRARLLPETTRTLLLVAAADGVGDAAVVLHAAETLGVHRDAADAAEAHGLLDPDGRLRFRHPLVRSAVYGAAAPAQRRAAHAALAQATNAGSDPDRRSWHRAHATPGPDEEVAGELVARAQAARRRGGIAAAAAFLERAVALTPEPGVRGARAVGAAEALICAGDLRAAESVLVAADTASLDALVSARLESVRGRLAATDGRAGDAATLLLDAGRRLEPLDVNLARDAHLDALIAALRTDRRNGDPDVRAIAHAVRDSRVMTSDPDPARGQMSLAFATLLTAGPAAARPALAHALTLVRATAAPTTRLRAAGAMTAVHLWDDVAWRELAREQLRAARETGALEAFPAAIDLFGVFLAEAGDLTGAEELAAEASTLGGLAGTARLPTVALRVAALRGREREAELLHRDLLLHARDDRHGAAVAEGDLALAVLHNGRGDYGRALEAAQRAVAADTIGTSGRALLELTEAAVRAGAEQIARDAAARLAERAPRDATPWARGTAAYAAALVADDARAEPQYREALALLGQSTLVLPRARAHLTYGEWLRRSGRRRDARVELEAANRLFEAMGAAGFVERAAQERRATGERVRRRTDDTRDDLTEQEEHIARLARDGRTNAEIGTQLFLSPRTVEWHLRKVFGKLNISSRRELDRALDDVPA